MTIALSQEEMRALVHALDSYLPQLRHELSRVKLERDRHEVVAMEGVLTELRRRVEACFAEPTAPI